MSDNDSDIAYLTWDDLVKEAAKMTPEQRKEIVCAVDSGGCEIIGIKVKFDQGEPYIKCL